MVFIVNGILKFPFIVIVFTKLDFLLLSKTFILITCIHISKYLHMYVHPVWAWLPLETRKGHSLH